MFDTHMFQQDLMDDKIHTFERIDNGSSFYFYNLLHSVKLSFSFKDQGWGNRKGQIYVIEKQEDQEEEVQQQLTCTQCCFRRASLAVNDNDDDDILGRIIQRSPIAEHHVTKCELLFRPEPGFSYGFCYKVGGGGGHSLTMTDIKLKSFVHSACIPLANMLMDKSPSPSSSSSRLFITNMLRYIIDTVTYFLNETTQQQQKREVGDHPCSQSSLDFFRQSTGLDLLNEYDMDAVRMMLVELDGPK